MTSQLKTSENPTEAAGGAPAANSPVENRSSEQPPAEGAGNRSTGRRRSFLGRQLSTRQLAAATVVLSLVAGGVLGYIQWWWGVFYPVYTYREFFPNGAVLAEVYVRRERAHRIDPTLWGEPPPKSKDWYWVPEFRGYHERTRKLAAHGFFRPFPVISGDPKRDQTARPWKGQVYEGLWRSYYENGQISEEGHYVAGEKSGEWTVWHETGHIQTRGKYARHMRQGLWEIYDPQGVLRSRLHFEDDQRHGLETTYGNEGKRTATIEWRNNVEHGLRTMFQPDGKTVHSTWNFSRGKLFGPHKQYDSAGRLLLEGNFEFDRKDGKWVRYYPSGQKHSEQVYLQDKLHGHEIIWNEDGSLKSEGEYRNDRRSGRWVLYDDKGKKIAEGTYVDGNRHGPWKMYDPDGTIKVIEFDKGKAVEAGTATR